jgi:hypothetical protein
MNTTNGNKQTNHGDSRFELGMGSKINNRGKGVRGNNNSLAANIVCAYDN